MSIVRASYNDMGLPLAFQGNPFIEALPPIMSDGEFVKALSVRPDFNLQDSRKNPPYLRIYDVDLVEQIYVPPSVAFEFARHLDMLLRRGYASRNPLSPEYVGHQYNVQALMKCQGGVHGTLAGIMTLKGVSGMGKSRLTRTLLSMYPQVIVHDIYRGKALRSTQIVWLSVEAPIAGSMKGFLMSLFQAIDRALGMTNDANGYAKSFQSKSNYSDLMSKFVQVAATHSLGILHVDDIQRIGETTSDREHVMQLIIRLANVAKFGIVFTGTKDIADVIKSLEPSGASKSRAANDESTFQQQFEVSRRMMNRGFFEISRATTPTDPFFVRFVKRLFEYQWLDAPLALDDKVLKLVYDLTGGVPALVVMLHAQAQIHALSLEADSLTPKHYLAVYRRTLKPLSLLLKRLRRGSITSQEFESGLESVIVNCAKPSSK